ncbi:reverse transcriptase domain-containing protein [Tanacetum coccineum]
MSSGAGLIPQTPEGWSSTNCLKVKFDATNNEAEYEALIVRLRIAEQMGAKKPSSECGFTPSGQSSEQNICCKGS